MNDEVDVPQDYLWAVVSMLPGERIVMIGVDGKTFPLVAMTKEMVLMGARMVQKTDPDFRAKRLELRQYKVVSKQALDDF